MKKFVILVSALLSFVVIGGVKPVNATSMLTLFDGTTTVTITDGQLGVDLNPLAGGVTYLGGVGNFMLNVTTGLTKPLIGSATKPLLDLNSVDVTSTGGGTLTITWFDDGFGPVLTPAYMETGIGGTTAGTVTLQSYLNGSFVDSLGPFSGGAFSGTEYETVSPGTPFSLTLIATITHKGAGVTSFDATAVVPEPSTLLLLGSGLVGLGLFGRRKKG